MQEILHFCLDGYIMTYPLSFSFLVPNWQEKGRKSEVVLRKFSKYRKYYHDLQLAQLQISDGITSIKKKRFMLFISYNQRGIS